MAAKTNTSSNDTPASSPKDETSGVSLKDDVRGLGQDAKVIATDVAAEAKKLATARLDSGKGIVAEGIGSVAGALRSSGDQLQGSPVSAVSSYVGSAADMVDGASRYLEDKSVGEVVSDVEDFARREPLIFLGGTFAVGFMLGRVLKASSPQGAEARAGQAGARRPDVSRARMDSAPRGQLPALRAEAAGLDRLAPSAPSSLGQAPTPTPTAHGPAHISSLGAGAAISSAPTTGTTTRPAGAGSVDPLQAGSSSVKKPSV